MTLFLLRQISKGVVKNMECVDLAIHLDLSQADIAETTFSSENPKDLSFDVLYKWKQKRANLATVSSLKSTLVQIHRVDLADNLMGKLADKKGKIHQTINVNEVGLQCEISYLSEVITRRSLLLTNRFLGAKQDY